MVEKLEGSIDAAYKIGAKGSKQFNSGQQPMPVADLYDPQIPPAYRMRRYEAPRL